MEMVPRELFVPSAMAGVAYVDKDLQVSNQRYLLEPMVLARLLQAAEISAKDKVLDIGPATGYSTAILARLSEHVVAVESDPVLYRQATDYLASLSVAGPRVYCGSLVDGYKNAAPYDVILINGSVDFVPNTLLDQLAEGGSLLAVVRHFGPARAAHTEAARIYSKINGHVTHRALFDANVKPLAEFIAKPSFTF